MPNQMFRNATQLFSLILPLKQKDDKNQKRPPPLPPPPERRPCVFCYQTRSIPTKYQLNPPSRLGGVDLTRFGDIFIKVN